MSSLIPEPPAVPDGGVLHDGALYVTERLLAVMREDLGRADTKASILLSGTIAVLAVCGAERSARAHGWRVFMYGGAVGLWCFGIVALVVAILPRTRSGVHPSKASYFGAANFAQDAAHLHRLLCEAGRDPVAWLALQAKDVGSILAAKYRWIRIGAACIGAGALLALTGAPW